MLITKRENTAAFTLLELLTVIIIIGILAALGLPNMLKMKEKSYDNEVKASLKLVQAAEKIYYMQNGFYYPHSSYVGTVDNTALNTNLKVFLPLSGGRAWDYTTATTTGTATASRLKTAGRSWTIAITDENPACSSGAADTCIP